MDFVDFGMICMDQLIYKLIGIGIRGNAQIVDRYNN